MRGTGKLEVWRLLGERAPAARKGGRLEMIGPHFIDRHLDGRTWACGDAFSMADCAAAPALFYALAYVPLPPDHVHLAAYFERLVAHPAVARTIDQARPWLKYFPGRSGMDERFFDMHAD
jgi:glutathione S-transferase